MFKCEHTGEMIGPGVPMNKVVTERRRRVYEKKIKRGPQKGTIELVDGWEIVKEIHVGPRAYQELTGETPRMVKVQTQHKDTKPTKWKDPRLGKKRPWQNPRHKKRGGGTRSAAATSQQSSRKPVVEKVNTLKATKV